MFTDGDLFIDFRWSIYKQQYQVAYAEQCLDINTIRNVNSGVMVFDRRL